VRAKRQKSEVRSQESEKTFNMQTTIVIIIVCLAAAYLVKTLIRKPKDQDSCGCGCTSCTTSTTCHEENKKEGSA
jgi:hypothetical protein